MGRRSPKNLVKSHGNAKLEKGPRKPKESKLARDTQGKTNGTQKLASNVTQEPMACWAIRGRINGRPKGTQPD